MATTTQYDPRPNLDLRLRQAGASKTVYALVTPEIEAVKAELLGNNTGNGPDPVRAAYLDQFRHAWTGKQNALHKRFFDTWLGWAKPMAPLNTADFPFSYPTAGASEPLFHLIADYGNRARLDGFSPRLAIFRGEYEGYRAYAEACGIPVTEYDRHDWRDMADTIDPQHLLCLSQPSAIDGMVWPEANAFLRRLSGRANPAQVVLDLTYVGATAEPPPETILADAPCVSAVVISLSKPFGTYYDRIGGVFCRSENLGLFGNQWFKNLTSLQLGIRLMERFDVFAMARRYTAVQHSAAEHAGQALGLALVPADVFILAQASAGADGDSDMASYLTRAPGAIGARPRLCLTPSMAERIGMAPPGPVS
ncbi:MAG: aminotransferase class I/II-fold pyridoxal phosphate-dependent enzyme [Mesorhizobium sp.]|nr:aminotransferase class I/II-fold pyridoxal phosphate-dependent enzyme [Mesorhizobium sp. M8A.F.Ca.ET.023.01.1.1]RWC78350.1 MAG: aminotransferase class I/II-fold pyridoxal phosphate-dependent enzyme [Mesorhizobium sp.]